LRPDLEMTTPQGPIAKIGGQELVNFASSDYLGLSSHAEVKKAAASAIEAWGVGVAAPRVAAGTLPVHTQLEKAIAELTGAQDAIVFPSGHHANSGLFEALLGDRDYVFCDEMVSPSLADGIRLSRARAYVYRNNDMEHLEDRLKRSRAARFRIIATDAVFPITGRVAKLGEIYALAEKYRAIVVADDSEGIGVVGDGRGTHLALDVPRDVDLVTGSFGHALGGGGGFIAGLRPLVGWLRQKSRSYVASTALAPGAAAAARRAIELVREDKSLRTALAQNLKAFEDAMSRDAGLTIDTAHPAISVLVRNAVLAQRLTDFLYRRGVLVIGYCHPVVPEGEARISLRVTARHRPEDLDRAAKAVGDGMRELRIQL
jgi:glycine C-acetyltransferase